MNTPFTLHPGEIKRAEENQIAFFKGHIKNSRDISGIIHYLMDITCNRSPQEPPGKPAQIDVLFFSFQSNTQHIRSSGRGLQYHQYTLDKIL